MKNLPSYIKNNKGRFATGVGMAGLGTGLAVKSVNNLRQKRKDEIEENAQR